MEPRSEDVLEPQAPATVEADTGSPTPDEAAAGVPDQASEPRPPGRSELTERASLEDAAPESTTVATEPSPASTDADAAAAAAGEEAGPEPAAAAGEEAGPEPAAAAGEAAGPEPQSEPELGPEAPAGEEAGPEAPAGHEPEAQAEPELGPEAPGGDEAEPDAAAGDASDARVATQPVASPAPATVAELIAATLRTAGVRLAFTVPGESFLPLLDSMTTMGIRVVATRHEGAAAFAAEAYGQLTGRPAACLGTRAVGAANLAIGIHTATADSTPMFVLVGQVSRSVRGREAFQEVDLVGTIGRLARWAGEIEDPATAAATLAEAVRATVDGRPGPALIVLPEDVLDLPLPDGTLAPVVRPRPEAPAADDVRAVLHLLAAAERPVILAGGGVLRARCSNDLVRFAELLHVPVVAGWRRGDVIPNDHPLYLGMTGFGSPSVVQERIENADALLVIGSRLGEVATGGYAVPRPGQAWIHVDVAPRDHAEGALPAPERAIQSDARAFLRAAVARLKDAVLVADLVAMRDAHNREDREAWEAATVVDRGSWDGPGVHPGRIIADLQRLLPEDAIVTTDAGSFSGWAARGLRFRRPGTFIGPTSGAMGYGLPAALAAALVHRERRVVALIGDGGMAMTMAELETAVREDAHVVAIVFDNEQYGMIHTEQVDAGSETTPGTTLGPIDFAAIARACGGRGIRVDSDAGFEPALRTALAASGPSVIQLTVDRRWISVDRPAVS
jgi:acetolactate synthase I/II/III large subunit